MLEPSDFYLIKFEIPKNTKNYIPNILNRTNILIRIYVKYIFYTFLISCEELNNSSEELNNSPQV